MLGSLSALPDQVSEPDESEAVSAALAGASKCVLVPESAVHDCRGVQSFKADRPDRE